VTPSEFAQLRDLIVGVAGEVRRVHERLDGVEARLDRMESRLDGLEHDQLAFQAVVAKHFLEVFRRLDALEERQRALEERQRALEEGQRKLGTDFDQIRGDFKAFGEGLQATNRRLDALAGDMNRRFDEQRTFTESGFREWGERVKRIEERLAA